MCTMVPRVPRANKPNGHALAMAEAFQGMIHDTPGVAGKQVTER